MGGTQACVPCRMVSFYLARHADCTVCAGQARTCSYSFLPQVDTPGHRWLAVWTDAAEAAEETAQAAQEPLAATGFSAQHYLWIYFALGGTSLIFQVRYWP